MIRRNMALLLCAVLLSSLVYPVATKAEQPPVPLVLIHGHGASPAAWKTTMSRLEHRGYRVGVNLFTIDLSGTQGQNRPMGLLSDVSHVAAEIRQIQRVTGAARVDVVGHSRGGLIARFLASGDTAVMIRRAVSLDTPHEGLLPEKEFGEMLKVVGVAAGERNNYHLPEDLQAPSTALATLTAREERFADRRAPALAVGATWREGMPLLLTGNDGVVALRSQLAWPGARPVTVRLGPTLSELNGMLRSDLAPLLLVWNSPHIRSQESQEVLTAIVDFLSEPDASPAPSPCDPVCDDWAGLRGHWAEAELRARLPGKLPYEIGPGGERQFEPDNYMTRAEFTYALVKALGLQERLGPPHFRDMAGHWALGYVEAAYDAQLVSGLSPDSFWPDLILTRAEAVTMIAWAWGFPTGPGATRFHDVDRTHWAGASIEAAADMEMVTGDERGFRPDDPVTRAEGSLMLIRSFGG